MPISTEVIGFVVKLFCLSTMFGMGLSVSLKDILSPFHNKLALAIIVSVNNVLLPLIGLVIVVLGTTLPEGMEAVVLPKASEVAFVLLLMASGTYLGPFFARLSHAPDDLAHGVMVVLVFVSIVSIPLTVMLVSSGSSDTEHIFSQISENQRIPMTLLTFQLLPLAIGLLVKERFSALADPLRPVIGQFATFLFLVLAALLLVWQGSPAPAAPEDVTERSISVSSMQQFIALLQENGWITSLSGLGETIGPYIFMAALSAFLMVVGNLTGKIINNMTKVDAPACPRIMTTSTAVRNVSAVLILLVSGSNGSVEDFGGSVAYPVGYVVAFYLISLIIAGVKVNGWAQETPPVVSDSAPPETQSRGIQKHVIGA
ncbi:MAG: hypothetical protein R2873_06145 [Caldilineaceae bacterium]